MWNKIIEIEKTETGAILTLDPNYSENDENENNIIDDLEMVDIYPVNINGWIYFMDYNRNVLMCSTDPFFDYVQNWIEYIFTLLKTDGSFSLFNVDDPEDLLFELEKSYDC